MNSYLRHRTCGDEIQLHNTPYCPGRAMLSFTLMFALPIFRVSYLFNIIPTGVLTHVWI